MMALLSLEIPRRSKLLYWSGANTLKPRKKYVQCAIKSETCRSGNETNGPVREQQCSQFL